LTAEESSAVIRARGLGKTYESKAGPIEAVSGLDLEVREGEIFGLLGPNGAGKTTTVRMLCGLLAPTAGQAHVEGVSVTADPDRVRRAIGLVPGDAGNNDLLTVDDELEFYGGLYGLSPAVVRERSAPLLARLDLGERREHRVGTFSKGMKRKVQLVRALLHRPRVLLLDEPTSGLDPAICEEVWDLLSELTREQGVTVILCSHHLEEVERLCERVAIIRRRLLVEGSLAELSRPAPRYRVELAEEAGELSGALEGLPVSLLGQQERELSFEPEPQAEVAEVVPEVVARLVSAGARILSLEPESRDLRTLYREVVRAPERAPEGQVPG